MNPEAEAYLKSILVKDLHELTEADVQFLKARWAYVGKNSRAKFEKVVKAAGKDTHVENKVADDENKARADWSEHPADQTGEDTDDEENSDDTDDDLDEDEAEG